LISQKPPVFINTAVRTSSLKMNIVINDSLEPYSLLTWFVVWPPEPQSKFSWMPVSISCMFLFCHT
jgi:hypothetical protein